MFLPQCPQAKIASCSWGLPKLKVCGLNWVDAVRASTHLPLRVVLNTSQTHHCIFPWPGWVSPASAVSPAGGTKTTFPDPASTLPYLLFNYPE